MRHAAVRLVVVLGLAAIVLVVVPYGDGRVCLCELRGGHGCRGRYGDGFGAECWILHRDFLSEQLQVYWGGLDRNR